MTFDSNAPLPDNVLFIDVETRSEVDLKKAGVYRYAEGDVFAVMLFQFAFGDDPVQVVDLARGERLPERVVRALTDPNIAKRAFNAAFELTTLGAFFPDLELDPAQWHCDMVHGYTLGLAGGLEQQGAILKLDDSHRKLGSGKRLIKLFCVPQKPTKKNGFKTWITPDEAPEDWEEFKRYAAMDVEAERALYRRLRRFPVSEREHKVWVVDQKINARGVLVDVPFVKRAIEYAEIWRKRLMAEAQELTKVDNPNSVKQLLEWLNAELDEDDMVEELDKKTVARLLGTVEAGTTAHRVLQIRKMLGKSSIKKYQRMLDMVCADGRVRGLFQFYGALRTGRWAGRGVQLQNLPSNKMPDLAEARALLRAGDFETLDLLFEDGPALLSELVRTAFIAPPGHTLGVVDSSQIEARILAWFANEEWRLEVFRTHAKIYEASAAAMFNVPIETIFEGGPNRKMRQAGKVAELALGFQGGPGALVTMGAVEMGLPVERHVETVKLWRAANQAIVPNWWETEKAAIAAVRRRTAVAAGHGCLIRYHVEAGTLFCVLPSGRRLAYPMPELRRSEKFDKDALTFMGKDEKGRWGREWTYAGKLVENRTQATARDVLADKMVELDALGYEIVLHVHDEIAAELPVATAGENLETMKRVMSTPVAWAPGLPLGAAGYTTPFYKKD